MNIILCISILAGCGLKKESDIDQVKRILAEYSNYGVKENFDGLVDLMHPDYVKRFSRNELIKDLKNGYHNESYDMSMSPLVFDSISPVYMDGIDRYVQVKAHGTGVFILKISSLMDTIKVHDLFIKACIGFNKQFGESNVNCNYTKKTVHVINYENFYLLYNNNYKKWFFLPTDQQRIKEVNPLKLDDPLH